MNNHEIKKSSLCIDIELNPQYILVKKNTQGAEKCVYYTVLYIKRGKMHLFICA